MLRCKKQLLGLVGLAFVAAMTAVAYALPTPEAAAAEDGSQTSSVGLTVRVQGNGIVPEVQFEDLNMDDVVVSSTFKTTIKYLKTKPGGLHVYLTDAGAVDPQTGEVIEGTAGTTIEIPLTCEIVYSDTDWGTCDVEYNLGADLTPEHSKWMYTTKVQAYSPDNLFAEDNTSFYYQSAHIVFNGEFNESSKNPIVEVLVNPEVGRVLIQVYDENGNKVFVNGGQDTPLSYTREELEAMGLTTDGRVKIELPFDKYNVKNGTYTAGLLAYNDNDDLIAMSTAKTKIEYRVNGGGNHPGGDDGDGNNPNKPEVPDTGSNMLRGLNISRADYIITGLVAFGMVTAFAVFLIVRRNKR